MHEQIKGHNRDTINYLINAWGVYLILEVQEGHLIDSRHFKRRGVYFHNCNKLNQTNKLSAKISSEFKNSGKFTPSTDISPLSRDPYLSL